jgi:hypothetical protein
MRPELSYVPVDQGAATTESNTIPSSQNAAQPATFNLMGLSLELRLAIYRFMFTPQILLLTKYDQGFIHDSDDEGATIPWEPPISRLGVRTPAVLTINREIREEALKHYKCYPLTRKAQRLVGRAQCIYMNLDTDYLETRGYLHGALTFSIFLRHLGKALGPAIDVTRISIVVQDQVNSQEDIQPGDTNTLAWMECMTNILSVIRFREIVLIFKSSNSSEIEQERSLKIWIDKEVALLAEWYSNGFSLGDGKSGPLCISGPPRIGTRLGICFSLSTSPTASA